VPVKKHSVEQIIAKLREIKKLTGQGMSIPLAAKKVGVTDQTFYRWRIRYGALKEEEAKRLRGEGKRHRSQSCRDRDMTSAAAMRTVVRRRMDLDLPVTFYAAGLSKRSTRKLWTDLAPRSWSGWRRSTAPASIRTATADAVWSV